MTLTGFGRASIYRLVRAIQRYITVYFYGNLPAPKTPITDRHVPKDMRNTLIIKRYKDGETLEDLAQAFSLSVARVHQIIMRWSGA